MENKKTKKPEKESVSENCVDKLCPFHGTNALKLRGRTFEGKVAKKLHGRVTIEFERMIFIRKFEGYEKRKTRLHARLPDCLKDVQEGDYIQISECRPVSKTIHFVVTKIIRKAE